jgi:hypothetical protein
MGLVTIGLTEIQIGTAAPNGTMPTVLTKVGKTYKDSCKLNQDAPDVTEHFEEGKASAEVRRKMKKVPKLMFQILDADAALLASLIGGSLTNGVWGFDGSETNANRAIRLKSEQGLWIDIPNGDIEAVVNAEFSTKGILLLDVTVTPLAVTAGKSILAYDGSTGLVVSPTSLLFTAAANATGLTITATSTGNLTYAGADSSIEWLTVTKALKVATVKVSANTNSEPRTAIVTIEADGLRSYVPVTQAGV